MIVYFYPAAMTPGCTTQACDFTDSLDSLQGAGYEVVGISPDKPAKLAKFRERDGLTITLASDEDRSVMTSYGAFGEKKLYGKVVQGVIRSTIVVDEDGKVALAQYNVKATGHVAKLRRDLGLDCRGIERHTPELVESVDTQVLGTCAFGRWGFTSRPLRRPHTCLVGCDGVRPGHVSAGRSPPLDPKPRGVRSGA